MAQEDNTSGVEKFQAVVKPLLRGWIHAGAAVGAVALTVLFCWQSRDDLWRLGSMLVFGGSMILLYGVSAIYHIGAWPQRWQAFWRSFDHANIYTFIAGTYTAIVFNVLEGWLRWTLLGTVWLLATTGFALAIFTPKIPRRYRVSLYIGLGWVGLPALPALLMALPWQGVAMCFLGGAFYTLGALVYGWRWPDPFPRFFGFHEIFHLFVVAGGAVFALTVWFWALP